MQWILLIMIVPYMYFLLKIYRSLLSIKPYSPSHTAGQFISVVVACRNEEKHLPVLLQNISLQDYNQEMFEVIIIDDNSTDRTFEIASGFRSIKYLKVLINSGHGKKKALRTGVAASSGNLIITTDADCRMGKSWLSTITSFFAENKSDLIVCPVILENRSGILRRFQELEYLSLQGVTAGTAIAGNPVMCNGANLAFKKEIYDKHSDNLNDEISSGDDVFLLHSVKKEPGNKISWLESEKAFVTTESLDSIGAFMKQRSRWISKAGTYKDGFTRILGIVTFVTILLELFLLFAGIFDVVFLQVLLVVFLLKSVTDFLVLKNTANRYDSRYLLYYFLPAQIIYPLYVISVYLYYLTGQKD